MSNPGEPIQIYDVASIVGKAYPLAFTPKNIVSGFSSSGIWPIDSNIFRDDEFYGSYATDRSDPSVPDYNILHPSLISNMAQEENHTNLPCKFYIK